MRPPLPARRRFGSLTTVSSQYNDSSGSVSPAEQRRREAAGTISNAPLGGDPWHTDGGSGGDKRRRASAVLGGSEHPSHSGNSGSSQSSSRSIATIARLPDHLSLRRQARHRRQRSSSDGEATPAATGTGDLTSTLLPQTPEWLRDGNLSVSDSGLETPHRLDDPEAEAGTSHPAAGGGLAESGSATYWKAAAAHQAPSKQQQQVSSCWM